MTTTSTCIFDMDGVLIDSGAHHRSAWQALLDELGVAPDPEFWRLTIGRPAEEAVPLLLGKPLPSSEAGADRPKLRRVVSCCDRLSGHAAARRSGTPLP